MASTDGAAPRPRVVFAGTPAFAVPSLEVLLAAPVELAAVYTQPDRPAGRGRRLRAGPVKARALAAGVPVVEVGRWTDGETAALERLRPDLLVVVAYGLILPAAALAVPRRGAVNLHASLLPRWRGAAPIARALLAGDRQTGVTLMQMEAGLDSGPILAQAVEPIRDDDSAGRLHDRLAQRAAALLAEHLPALLAGTLPGRPQDPAAVTYAAKLGKDEAWLDWRRDAAELVRQVRAFDPWPVAQTHADGRVLRVWAAEADPTPAAAAPGTVLDEPGLVVACGAGRLRLRRVQSPGGRPLAVEEWLRGHARPARFDGPPGGA